MASPPDRATRVYRIVSPRYPPFDGSGTHRWGSRWISPGQYVVHAAQSYALAVLENLVHWQTSAVPKAPHQRGGRHPPRYRTGRARSSPSANIKGQRLCAVSGNRRRLVPAGRNRRPVGAIPGIAGRSQRSRQPDTPGFRKSRNSQVGTGEGRSKTAAALGKKI